MANVLDLRRRIRSVKNTRQITKAMKMVSAAKLRRAQERAMAARPYARMISSVLDSLAHRIEIFDPASGDLRHPLFITREEKRVLLVVVTGDKGFAGAFNANILKAAQQFIDANAAKHIDLEPIGRKGRDTLRKQYPAAVYVDRKDEEGNTHSVRDVKAPIEITGDHPGLLEKLEHARVLTIAEDLIRRYVADEIDAVYVVFNEFKSVIQQRVVVERLLPILEVGKHDVTAVFEPSHAETEQAAHAAISAGVPLEPKDTTELEREAEKFGTAQVDYIYEQPAAEQYEGLLPRYVASVLFHAMSESVAAEHAARMTAMDAASNNASEMIDSLTLIMNRVRQAAITKEIIEIVSGAAAV